MCLLVDFGKVFCLSANELQQNSNASSREDYIPQILTVLLEILCVYIWPLWPFVFCLSFVNNSLNNVTNPSTNQRFWPDSGQILRHQYGISVAESQTFLLAKRSRRRRTRRNGCSRRLRISVIVHLSASDKLAVVHSSCLFGAESYSEECLARFRMKDLWTLCKLSKCLHIHSYTHLITSSALNECR